MKLGILVNTDKHFEDVIGLTKAAISKGHEVIIFTMDDGCMFLGNPGYAELCKLQGVHMSFCDHNARELEIKTEEISDELVCGSQYENAVMAHNSDKLIVL
jgi:predicted peroxiredoxin